MKKSVDKGKSKVLLEVDSASSIESKLLFCKSDDVLKPRLAKSVEKSGTCAVPESDVMGKVKNFLGVIAEANKKLEADAGENSENYDIERLNGDESEVIELDLMLGIADLHTPEAVAAAESALAGHHPALSFGDSDSSDDDDDEDDDDDDDDDSSSDGEKMSKDAPESSGKAVRKEPSKKRAKIVELS